MATKITAFDKSNLKLVGAEIEAAVKAVAEKYGLKLAGGIGGRYSTLEYTIKGTLKVTDEAVLADRAETEFKAYCWHFHGFTPEMYGVAFKTAGKTFKLSGFKLGAPKMPVLAKCVEDGREYKFPVSVVAQVRKQNPQLAPYPESKLSDDGKTMTMPDGSTVRIETY